MGVRIGDIIPPEAVERTSLKGLAGWSIALDTYNMLYQFLSTIRGPDGRALMDRRGRVTSHLSGLFFRTINLLEEGVRPVYVFDGRPPELKRETIDERMKARRQAAELYTKALEAGRIEEAKKYAQRASTLEEYMVESSVALLDAMRVPYVRAPSEGEAQAAYMAMKGDVHASGSQDMDSLLFGSPRLVRNLSVVGRRKLPGRKEYVDVEPEVIYLDRLLLSLGLSREQLIDIGLFVGTDYSGQVRSVGPKTALKLIREHGTFEKAAESLGVSLDFDPAEVRRMFMQPNVTGSYRIEWGQVSHQEVESILCGEYDFSRERVRKALQELDEALKAKRQRPSLDAWLE